MHLFRRRMVRAKSRHARDESDPLLGLYSLSLAATASVRNNTNALYSSNNGTESSPLKKTLRLFYADDDNVGGSFTNADESKRPQKQEKKTGYRVHTVSYTAHNHVQVLFRMYGSAL